MPDYDPNEYPERWLLGACSSGDPLRWAVVAVAEKVKRLNARIEELETPVPAEHKCDLPPGITASEQRYYVCHCLGCKHDVHCRGRACREGCPR